MAVCQTVSAQFVLPAQSARSAAMGGAQVGENDALSLSSMVASAAFASHTVVALAYTHTHSLKELAYKSVATVIPLQQGAIVVAYTHYGSTAYNEQRTTAGYALRITPTIALGVALHYLHSGTADPYYHPQNLLTATVAAEVHPTGELTIGAKVFNPILVKLHDGVADRVPAMFVAGAAYRIMPQLFASMQIEKDLYAAARVRVGVEYGFMEHYFLRVGLSTAPIMYTLGLGTQWGNYALDISTALHPVLGFTPQVSAQYTF